MSFKCKSCRYAVASEGGITSSTDVDADGDGYDDNFRVSEEDDGVAQLSPDEYIALRIVKERDGHRRKAATCQRALGAISVGNYVLGGVGTYLSTAGEVVNVMLPFIGCFHRSIDNHATCQ